MLLLNGTSLANIPYGVFHHQRNLSYLDISFNNLKKINFDSFWRDFPMLETFFVNGNSLTEVNGLSKGDFPNVRFLGITKNNFTCKYLSEYLRQWTGITLEHDDELLLLHKSHIDKIVCNEDIQDHNIPGFVEYSNGNINAALNTMTHQPAPKLLSEHTDRSTDRVLLILILIVLCTIGIVLIIKNLAALWVSPRRLILMGERSVTYFNDKNEGFEGKSIQTIDTNLLHDAE